MKQIFLSSFFSMVFLISMAQNNIGIGTQTPHASAMLDVSSTSKGLLAPRMTTAQRNAIVSPAKGLLVYDTDINSLYHYNGSSWTNLAGGGGGFTLPYTGSVANASAAFSISNTGTGQGIAGEASQNSRAAIVGTTHAAVGGYGVYGIANSESSFGIAGTNPTGVAVYGFSSSGGTALRGVSSSGYALNITGNVRISGGNTNPSTGAVLTSTDVNGNAVWAQPHKVAFRASGVYSSFELLPKTTIRKMHFSSESYDYSNSFQPTTNANPTVAMSSFVVPVTGVYHWELSIGMNTGQGVEISNFKNAVARIMVNRGGNVFTLLTLYSARSREVDFLYIDYLLNGSSENWLLAGDIVYVDLFHDGNAQNVRISTLPSETFFNGRLVIPD